MTNRLKAELLCDCWESSNPGRIQGHHQSGSVHCCFQNTVFSLSHRGPRLFVAFLSPSAQAPEAESGLWPASWGAAEIAPVHWHRVHTQSGSLGLRLKSPRVSDPGYSVLWQNCQGPGGGACKVLTTIPLPGSAWTLTQCSCGQQDPQ